jgi:hypothetical protein
MDRGRMPSRSAAALLALGLMAGQAGAQANDQFSGVWMIETPMPQVHTVKGALPPFKPAARKLYDARIAARKAGDTSFDGATWCASLGVPRVMFVPYPFEIVVRPTRVAFLYEWNWWSRVVDMSGAPLEVISPNSMGVARGRWDGGALVVETNGLDEGTLLDSAGAPHSEDAKVTERLTLQGNDVLEDLIRVDDPENYTQPWETRVTYRRQAGASIPEDVCLDRIKAGEPAVKGD